LDLSANELVVVPLTLARLSKLTVLGLGKNRIRFSIEFLLHYLFISSF